MGRMLVPAALALALGGCSLLLDFDREGLACDAKGLCAEGYTCTAAGTCLPDGHPDTLCGAGCGPLETCFKARCVPVCDDRACPAGSSCSEGACRANKRDQKLGAPCDADSDCLAPGLCMRPYGGGTGVCTRTCSTSTDCIGATTECLPFTSGSQQIQICASPAFLGCAEEADCAPSGLSCGVYALNGAGTKAPVTACRARITADSVKGIGEACSEAVPCVNGLCVRMNGAGDLRCTTPCASDEACGKTLEAQALACAQVTVEPSTSTLPRLRPQLCVEGGASMLFSCAASAATCHADAPYCVDLSGSGGFQCVTACGEGSERCPSTGAPACSSVAFGEPPQQTNRDVCRPQ